MARMNGYKMGEYKNNGALDTLSFSLVFYSTINLSRLFLNCQHSLTLFPHGTLFLSLLKRWQLTPFSFHGWPTLILSPKILTLSFTLIFLPVESQLSFLLFSFLSFFFSLCQFPILTLLFPFSYPRGTNPTLLSSLAFYSQFIMLSKAIVYNWLQQSCGQPNDGSFGR